MDHLQVLAWIAVIAAALFAIVWRRSRVRARRRWRAALDSFAELQIEHEPPQRGARRHALPRG
jgi:hypothetical protein